MTTTATATRLVTGDRVNYRGSEGTVVTLHPTHADMDAAHVLVRFDETDPQPHRDRGFWPWEGGDVDARYPEPGLYYFIARDDDHMTRLAPRPLQVGDVVDATRGGLTRRGLVYATQRDSEPEPEPRYIWVGGAGDEWHDAYSSRYSDISEDSYAGSFRVAMPHDMVTEDVRGHWFYVKDEQRDHTVTLVGPKLDSETVEEGPSEPVDVAALKAEIEALKAAGEALGRQNEQQASTISTLKRDIVTIGEHMRATANRRDWCGEYEAAVTEVFDALSTVSDDLFKAAASRETEWTVRYTYSTTVTAASEQDAIRTAQDGYWQDYGDWEAEEE